MGDSQQLETADRTGREMIETLPCAAKVSFHREDRLILLELNLRGA